MGQGTTTRLPQLAQVASNIYQEISKLSKVARIEKTLEPQGQACNGPRDLRSVPNLSGILSLFFRRVGRRNGNRTVSTVQLLLRPIEGRPVNSLTLIL